MMQLFATMLAAANQAERYGVALNPDLRQALEAELRFPAKSSGPSPVSTSAADEANNVVPLPSTQFHAPRRLA